MDSLTNKPSICRHIKTSGHRCQSIAIATSAYCYYHRTLHQSHRAASALRSAPLRPETVQYLLQNGQSLPQYDPSPALNFPPLEDADSVQLAISMLFAAIAASQIGPSHARSLLYALQIAAFNVRAITPTPASEAGPETLARRIVRNSRGQFLAAPGDNNGVPSQSDRPESLLARFFEENFSPKESPDEQITPLESNS
jgi:hypothetical protein